MSSASYFTMYGALRAALTPAPRARDSETEENQQLRGDDDDDDDFSDEDDYEEYEELVRPLSHGPAQLKGGADAATAQEIDEADREAFLDSYVPTGQLEPGRTLADLIMEKIGQQEQAGKGKEPGASRAPTLSPLEEEPRD